MRQGNYINKDEDREGLLLQLVYHVIRVICYRGIWTFKTDMRLLSANFIGGAFE